MLAVWEALKEFWGQVLALIPRVLAGIVLLIGGWLLARLVRQGTLRLLRFAHLDAPANEVYWTPLLTMVLAGC